ncbi:MAG: glycosyltransferase [Rhodoferax sp.]|nr:glycosyltransferase [Rhodoferax sp.]
MTATATAKAPTLGIFILCHNRPEETRHAIRSVLEQSDPDFTLTISDNSSNDEVQAMVAAEFPTVRYVRRTPMLPAMQHFNRCIDDVRTDYFCLFHDDDLMAPRFVEQMKMAALAHPQAIALGCNAVIEVFGQPQAQASFLARKEHDTIATAQSLAARYFSRAQSGIAPFPGYVYQTRLVGGLRFLTDGGKYADVTWLLELARKAAVVWIRLPLMTYRMHGGNDGNTESRRDRLRFLAYLKRNQSWLGQGILQDYRCSFVYKTLLKQPDSGHAQRRRAVARAFLSAYRWTRYARAATYQALLERALVKRAQQA